MIIESKKFCKAISWFIPVAAITLYPFIICIDKEDKILINHESIHLKQQRELLVIPFFIIYLIHWMINLVKYNGDFDKAYLKATHLRHNNPVKYVSSQLGRDLISKEINFLFVYNANPAATSPNQTLVKKGLLREDLFVVVHDLFLTDTALYADIVLPAASFFETMDIHVSYWHYYLSLNQKAIEPIVSGTISKR